MKTRWVTTMAHISARPSEIASPGGRANWNSMIAVTEAAITPMQRKMKMLVARAIPIRPYSRDLPKPNPPYRE